ncbi:putative LTR retrotransposon, partial [Pseudoloma neurophilia]
MQIYDGKEQPVYWLSRLLLPRERNYSVTEKEMLAIVWTVKKLKPYLGGHFVIKTDHKALKYIMNRGQSTSRLEKWMMTLQEYKFDIHYIKGSENILADFLSRPMNVEEVAILEFDENDIINKVHIELGHSGIEATTLFITGIYDMKNVKEKVKHV